MFHSCLFINYFTLLILIPYLLESFTSNHFHFFLVFISFSLISYTESWEHILSPLLSKYSPKRIYSFPDGTHSCNFCDSSLHRHFQAHTSSHFLCVWVQIHVNYSFIQQPFILVQVTINLPFDHCNYLFPLHTSARVIF